ncbi:MAG: hypothetical protein CVU78_07095 [Elusimicrobia bacterium HGW-Elusimicrobia-2]|nr:MAG: hypothetical protein CVU78_07095 [Elusimicrobia bacterium HGW-Elusimicrobia-2]
MERKNDLFLATLIALHEKGVLRDIILVGSWCQHFYKGYFNNAPEIPVVRTLDIDFLVPNPPGIKKDVNIPDILDGLGFMPSHNYTTGYTKYVHPELELEFLTPDLGRGKGIGEFLLRDASQRKKISKIFNSQPKKWRSKIMKNLEAHSAPLFNFLSQQRFQNSV